MPFPEYTRSAYATSGGYSPPESNPFLGPTRQIAELVARLSALQKQPASNGSPGAMGGMSDWGTHVARPADPEVRDYMSNVLGGQRNTLDDYVRRAAGASTRRGGYNKAGSPPLDSALYQQAIESLAKGYGDRFRDAMSYNKYVKGTESTQFSDNMRNLQNLLSLQQRYLSSSSDWQQKMGSPPRVSTTPDDSQDRALKELTLERLRRQMETERQQNVAAKEDRQRALDDKLATATKWTQLMQKAGVASKLGGSGLWTAEDAALADLLGVKMGTQSPWQRRIQVSRRG
ncbi:MAG: hypothetical protein ACLP5H_06975 [Desulfomonilaceae bacterium]